MRPKGWKNPYIHESEPRVVNLDFREAAYEAGADAYEEGLKKEGSYQPCIQRVIGSKHTSMVYFYEGNAEAGYLVFIPEE